MNFHVFLAAALAVSLPALATPQPRNATDMWFDPAESGWGLNVIHQGDTLFATLFVFGSDGQPKWFVASNLSGGPTTYAGALSECQGPYFNGPFSAGPVTCREVGPMRFDLGDRSAVVEYTVDAVRVSKQVQRFTFRRVSVGGAYEGAMINGNAGGNDWTLRVQDNGSTVEMDASNDALACTYSGTPAYDGQFQTVTGTYRCGTQSGPWTMTVDPATEGFTGAFTGYQVNGGRIAAGRFAGETSMQGHGWRNDMWFVPSESGWGLNVIEQGNTLFATLFVYDAQRRPRWYVASNLTPTSNSGDASTSYTGALFESTGPYFGTAFNPAAVTRREVGQLFFQAREDGRGSVMYSVDGMTVSKSLERFAFRKQDFSGSYRGIYSHDRPALISIDDSGSTFRMRLVDEFGGMGTCDFTAPSVQVGSLRSMNGTYSCGAGSTTGTFAMKNATVSAHGFTARFETPSFALRTFVNGHISGARQ